MADESALQGPPSHLANGSRGRAHILPYQPAASQVMSPTDLPQCRQLPGGSAKLLDRLESTQILGLECLLPDLELRLQHRSGECLQKLFTSIWVMKKPLGRGLFMSSKRPTMLPPRESINTQSWKRLRDLFEQNTTCSTDC